MRAVVYTAYYFASTVSPVLDPFLPSRDKIKWRGSPFDDFLPMPSLSTTSSAHCMCLSSAGSARSTSVALPGRMGRVADCSSVVVLLDVAVEDCVASRGGSGAIMVV